MFAENFVDLLAQKNLVSSEIVAGLRERIAQAPQAIPAQTFAERLVDHRVLTPFLADALLRELRAVDKVLLPSEPPLPPPPINPVAAILDLRDYVEPKEPPRLSPPSTPLSSPLSPRPRLVGGTISLPTSHKTEEFPSTPPKRFTKQRTADNPWDSKLILFGGGGLLALFLIGFVLFGSLFRRSADTMFGIADQAYENGSYSQAIRDYAGFIKTFPNHSNTSLAKIRLALARIRLTVDTKSDWAKALETATVELKEVENEPMFFEDSKAELAVLLPKIATALAAVALEKSSPLYADQAEEALSLVDKYIPRSRRPGDQLIEVQAKINRVRRGLVIQDNLDEAEKELEPLLNATAWTKSTLDECFTLLDVLLKDSPEVDDEPKFLSLLRTVTENAHRAVEPIPDDELGSVQWAVSAPSENATPIVSLFYRNHQSDAPVTEEQTIIVCTDGAVYGLRASDGTPLWQRANVVGKHADWGTAPLFQYVPLKKQLLQSTVLFLDSRNWTLLLLHAPTGEPVWSLAVGEPFRISNVVSDEDRATVALATETGKLQILSFGKDVDVRGFRLPQPTNAAPFIDPVKKVVYQLADRETLYVLSPDDSQKNRSVFTAHKPSTIRTMPIRFGPNLLLVFQTGIRDCSLAVLDIEQNLETRQQIPIPGLVDAVPEVDGSFAVLAADGGATFQFELADGQLQKIAEGSVGGETIQRGVARFVSQVGKNVWVADWQLMRFEAQLAQSRLLPRESVKRNIVTLQPLRRIGKTLFHAYRLPSLGGVGVQAVSIDNAAVLWETEFSDAIVIEPQVKADEATIHTASGKAYTLNIADMKEPFLGKPTTLLPSGTFEVPLADVLPMKDGFDVWIPHWTPQNRTVRVYDPTATDATRFRTLLLPTPPAVPPIALDGRLLAPLSDGQIALFDAKTGAPVALPFVSTIAAERQPLWTSPTAIPNTKEFLVVNNRPDENNRVVLYRIAFIDDGETKLSEKDRLTLDRPIRSPIAVAGPLTAMVDDRNVFLTVKLDDLKPGTATNLAAACVWGPYALDDGFVLATTNSTLHFFDADGERFSCSSPTPVGKPFLDGNTVLFNSSDGKFWSVDRKTGNMGPVIGTGISASVGPIRVGRATLCCGQDGVVYGIQDSANRDTKGL